MGHLKVPFLAVLLLCVYMHTAEPTGVISSLKREDAEISPPLFPSPLTAIRNPHEWVTALRNYWSYWLRNQWSGSGSSDLESENVEQSIEEFDNGHLENNLNEKPLTHTSSSGPQIAVGSTTYVNKIPTRPFMNNNIGNSWYFPSKYQQGQSPYSQPMTSYPMYSTSLSGVYRNPYYFPSKFGQRQTYYIQPTSRYPMYSASFSGNYKNPYYFSYKYSYPNLSQKIATTGGQQSHYQTAPQISNVFGANKPAQNNGGISYVASSSYSNPYYYYPYFPQHAWNSGFHHTASATPQNSFQEFQATQSKPTTSPSLLSILLPEVNPNSYNSQIHVAQQTSNNGVVQTNYASPVQTAYTSGIIHTNVPSKNTVIINQVPSTTPEYDHSLYQSAKRPLKHTNNHQQHSSLSYKNVVPLATTSVKPYVHDEVYEITSIHPPQNKDEHKSSHSDSNDLISAPSHLSLTVKATAPPPLEKQPNHISAPLSEENANVHQTPQDISKPEYFHLREESKIKTTTVPSILHEEEYHEESSHHDVLKAPDSTHEDLANHENHDSHDEDAIHHKDETVHAVGEEPVSTHHKDEPVQSHNENPASVHHDHESVDTHVEEPIVIHHEDEYAHAVGEEPVATHHKDESVHPHNENPAAVHHDHESVHTDVEEPVVIHHEDKYAHADSEEHVATHHKDESVHPHNENPAAVHHDDKSVHTDVEEPVIIHHKDESAHADEKEPTASYESDSHDE